MNADEASTIALYGLRSFSLILFLPIRVLFSLLPGYVYSSCFSVSMFIGVLIALSYIGVMIMTPLFPPSSYDFIDKANNIIHLMLVFYTVYLLITGKCKF